MQTNFKRQVTIVKRNSDVSNHYILNIDDNQVTSEKSIELLDININKNLSFDEHVYSLCKKAINQLNVMSRLHRYLGFKEKETMKLE